MVPICAAPLDQGWNELLPGSHLLSISSVVYGNTGQGESTKRRFDDAHQRRVQKENVCVRDHGVVREVVTEIADENEGIDIVGVVVDEGEDLCGSFIFGAHGSYEDPVDGVFQIRQDVVVLGTLQRSLAA